MICAVLSCSVVSDSLQPHGYTVHGILQARILEWVAFPFSKGSSQTGIEPRSLALQGDSLPAEPPGKPKNTGVGSLSLLHQWILTTQELNQGLLQCNPWMGKIPWRRERLPTTVFWPGEFHVHGVAKSRTWLSNFHFKIIGVHEIRL